MALPPALPLKDPDATELYGVEFADLVADNRLDPAAVSGHQVLAPAGLVVHSSARNGTEVTARIAGGEPGQVYGVTFRLLVADPLGGAAPPLKFDRTVTIRVEQR